MKKIIKNKNILIAILFYLLSGFILFNYIVTEFMSNKIISELFKMLELGISCGLIYFGSFFLSKHLKNNNPMKFSLWTFLILYLIFLITLVFFDDVWGRRGFYFIALNSEYSKLYINEFVNLIPLKTIVSYIRDMFSSLLDSSTIFYNLLGNIVCLMPLSFFVTLLFNKINTLKKFLIVVFSFTFGIEIIQFLTMCGSCDIDDIVLNTFGAIIMFKFLKIESVNNLIKNIFLLEKNKINWNDLKKVLLAVIIILGLILSLIKVRNIYYDNKISEISKKYNYNLEIIDESSSCSQSLDKFYEDELYIYYFDCVKSDKMYAKINNGEKYLITELLNNNPTDYFIDIMRFEREGLDYIRENKYKELQLKFDGTINTKIVIKDDNILEIKNGDTFYDLNTTKINLYLVPKSKGTTIFEIQIINSSTNKKVDFRKYSVIIDEKMRVSYKELKD